MQYFHTKITKISKKFRLNCSTACTGVLQFVEGFFVSKSFLPLLALFCCTPPPPPLCFFASDFSYLSVGGGGDFALCCTSRTVYSDWPIYTGSYNTLPAPSSFAKGTERNGYLKTIRHDYRESKNYSDNACSSLPNTWDP